MKIKKKNYSVCAKNRWAFEHLISIECSFGGPSKRIFHSKAWFHADITNLSHRELRKKGEFSKRKNRHSYTTMVLNLYHRSYNEWEGIKTVHALRVLVEGRKASCIYSKSCIFHFKSTFLFRPFLSTFFFLYLQNFFFFL